VYKYFLLTKSYFYALINITNLNYFGGNMNRKISLFVLVTLIVLSLTSCVTLYQEEANTEKWTRIYRLDTTSKNSIPVLISNFSLRGEIIRTAINPISKENRVIWVKDNNEIYRSFEDKAKNIDADQEPYFKNFALSSNTKQIYINWMTSNNRFDQWQKDHFIFYLESDGTLWTVDNETETSERWNENITLPIDIDPASINISHNEKDEYPVIYKNSVGKPTRINGRTGFHQIYADVTIPGTMLIDEVTGEMYEIRESIGIIHYNTSGSHALVNANLQDYNIIAPRMVNGSLYYGLITTEVNKTKGRVLYSNFPK